MKKIEKDTAYKIAASIIQYLEKNYPDKKFVVKYNHLRNKDTAQVCVKEKGLFGTQVCSIDNCITSDIIIYKAINTEILPQKKLEQLMSNVDVYRILFAAAVKS